MILFLVLATSIFGGLKEFQDKYDYCESIKFESEYCSTQLELNKLGEK